MLCDTLDEREMRGIDRLVGEVLAQAAWAVPPVDVLRVARKLGMSVAIDQGQEPRGRHVRLGGRTAIFLRPEPRPERLQWTIAHEIGEALLHRLDGSEHIDEWGEGGREHRANLLATRLLLPERWFERDARACRCDLFELKLRYATASHELIAWRLLDLAEPAVTTVIDQGKLTRRRSNLTGCLPPWSQLERTCLAEVQATGRPARREDCEFQVAAWPVHEPGWRREIVRLAWRNDARWG